MKKFLSILSDIIGKAKGVIPWIRTVVPDDKQEFVNRTEDGIAKLGDITIEVELMAEALRQAGKDGLTGPEKLAAAVPKAVDALQLVLTGKDYEIGDPEMFKAGATEVMSGIAKCMNARKKK